MRSFDAPRERPVPRRFRAETLEGEVIESEFTSRCLILAVKEDCLGCRSVFEAGSGAFGDVSVLIVARTDSREPWWETSVHPVLISPTLLDELDVRWPPFYVLIDPRSAGVLCEGVVFGPAQVRDEISPYLV